MKNLWQINAERHKTKHPTEKPETLLNRIILLGSNENEVVLDPFLGSGTTGVVAVQTNRKFIGIEISKEYFDIASQRIEQSKNNLFSCKSNKLGKDKLKITCQTLQQQPQSPNTSPN